VSGKDVLKRSHLKQIPLDKGQTLMNQWKRCRLSGKGSDYKASRQCLVDETSTEATGRPNN
jgi:hypothetical protein